MRIDYLENKALEEAIRGVHGEVYLFGSRVDDKKRGGDIDLLILTEENSYRVSRDVTVRFRLICEEKIDVLVLNPKCLTKEQRAFLRVIDKVKIR